MSLIESKFSALKIRVENALAGLKGEVETACDEKPPAVTSPVYTSLDAYRRATGKRFRRSREEIARNLSPEAAFLERQEKSQL